MNTESNQIEKAAPPVAVTDAVGSFRDTALADIIELREQVRVQLFSISDSSKRLCASVRLHKALLGVANAFVEINAALDDVEDAV